MTLDGFELNAPVISVTWSPSWERWALVFLVGYATAPVNSWWSSSLPNCSGPKMSCFADVCSRFPLAGCFGSCLQVGDKSMQRFTENSRWCSSSFCTFRLFCLTLFTLQTNASHFLQTTLGRQSPSLMVISQASRMFALNRYRYRIENHIDLGEF